MTAPSHVRVAPVVGKVTIYHAETGAAMLRWPVDARDLIASGDFSWSPPDHAVPRPEWARGLTERADTTVDTSLSGLAPATPVDDAPPPSPAGVPLTPLGEPVRATRAHEATPAVPYQHPTGYTGKRDKSGRR